jgi:hypothetical protein
MSDNLQESAAAPTTPTTGNQTTGNQTGGNSTTPTPTPTPTPIPMPETATLTVIKDVTNSTASASQFTMHVAGTSPNPANFAGSETGVDVSLGTGGFTVTETKPTDTFTGPFFEGDCNANGSGTIAAGQHLTCTVKNVGPPCVGCFQKLLSKDQIANLLTLTKTDTLEQLCNLLETHGISATEFTRILNTVTGNFDRVVEIINCIGLFGPPGPPG